MRGVRINGGLVTEEEGVDEKSRRGAVQMRASAKIRALG